MKKLMAVLLVLAMVMSLGGCAMKEAAEAVEKTEEAMAQARELIDNGDYEQAIELLSELEVYSRITELLDEAAQAQMEQEWENRRKDASFLVGTWRCIDQNDMSLTFQEDGICLVSMQGDELSGEFFMDSGSVQGPMGAMTLTEYEGVMCLASDAISYRVGGEEHNVRFLREEDYENLGPRTVEITMENWETYFELRFAPSYYRDDFGDIEYVGFGYFVYLRDEYVDKLFNGYPSVDVAFKLECDSGYRYVTNPTQPDYSIEGVPPYWTSSLDTFTATVYDNRGSDYYVEGDAEYGAVCGNLSAGGMSLEEGIFPVQENGRIIAVEGMIVLYP